VYLVKSGKSFGNGNLIVNSLTVPAGETVFFNDERIILAGGDEIWVATDAALPNSIAITVSSLAV
jgi:hypothetical protein